MVIPTDTCATLEATANKIRTGNFFTIEVFLWMTYCKTCAKGNQGARHRELEFLLHRRSERRAESDMLLALMLPQRGL